MVFGSCCESLRKAMHDPPSPLMRVEVDGTLFMAVGYAQTERGVAWFDHAVMFCPFCGTRLQTPDEVKRRSDDYSSQHPLT